MHCNPMAGGPALGALLLFLAAVSAGPAASAEQARTGTFRADLKKAGTHLYANVPPATARRKGVPLVVSCHGAGGTAENHIRLWSEAAGTHGVIVLAPKSAGPTWGHVDAPAMKAVVDWALERFPRIDPDRILLTGFSAGGHNALIQGMRFSGTWAALAAVAGFQIEPAFVKKASHLPVLMLVGSRDGANLGMYHETRSALEQAGFDVTGEIRDGVGHSYPRGTSDRICTWFLGHATRVKLERRLERASSLAGSGARAQALLLAERVSCAHTAGCPPAEAEALAAVVERAREEADRLWKEWREAGEDEVMAGLDRARRQERRSRWTEAARRYAAFLKAHPEGQAAAYARARLEAILTHPEHGEKTADRLAGRECEELLRKAERSREKGETEEAVEGFRRILREHPHTSHAQAAREALAGMGVPEKPEPPCRIPEELQERLENAARGALLRDRASIGRLGTLLKKLFADGHTEAEVNQVLKRVGARYDRSLGRLFPAK